MEKNSKIKAARYRRTVGSTTVSNLKSKSYINLIFRNPSEFHLINQFAFGRFFNAEKYEYVIFEAVKDGGFIANNTYCGNFIYDNLSSKTEIKNTHINIDASKKVSIKELTETIKEAVGCECELYFNYDKPDGTIRKITDSSKLKDLGWEYRVDERLYN